MIIPLLVPTPRGPLPAPTEVLVRRSVLPGGRDGGEVRVSYYGGTEREQISAERTALAVRR